MDMLVLTHEEPFNKPKNSVKTRPMPQRLTLNSFIQNKFDALSDNSECIGSSSVVNSRDKFCNNSFIRDMTHTDRDPRSNHRREDSKETGPTMQLSTQDARSSNLQSPPVGTSPIVLSPPDGISLIKQSPPDGTSSIPTSRSDGPPPPPSPHRARRPAKERSLASLYAEATARRPMSICREAWQEAKQLSACDCTKDDCGPPILEESDDEDSSTVNPGPHPRQPGSRQRTGNHHNETPGTSDGTLAVATSDDHGKDCTGTSNPCRGTTQQVGPTYPDKSSPLANQDPEHRQIKLADCDDARNLVARTVRSICQEGGIINDVDVAVPMQPRTYDGPPRELSTLEWSHDDDSAMLATEDEVDIAPAADSGAVDHVAGPGDIPGSALVVADDDTRDFRSANNGVIKNHGQATIELTQEGGPTLTSTVQVADVSRPLHSVSKICDGPCEGQEKEMLFMKGEAVVVPAGTFSRLLASVTPLVRYKRSGGLYVAKMRARTKSSFTRPDPAR